MKVLNEIYFIYEFNKLIIFFHLLFKDSMDVFYVFYEVFGVKSMFLVDVKKIYLFEKLLEFLGSWELVSMLVLLLNLGYCY
jgi:hypothetical protein